MIKNNINKVRVIDHGNVFKTKHWYTFYCPHCGSQITKEESEKVCEACGKAIKW